MDVAFGHNTFVIILVFGIREKEYVHAYCLVMAWSTKVKICTYL